MPAPGCKPSPSAATAIRDRRPGLRPSRLTAACGTTVVIASTIPTRRARRKALLSAAGRARPALRPPQAASAAAAASCRDDRGKEYDVQIAIPVTTQRIRDAMAHNAFNTLKSFNPLPARPASSTRCPRWRRRSPRSTRLPVSHPHRAGVGAAQLRRQEGHRGARAAARQLAAQRRRAPTRSPSSSRASCCRTSPACRCWPTSPPCAASPQRLGKNPKSIEPLVPVDLVVDHSVHVDHYGTHERARPQHEARVPAQPRALPVHEVGHAGVRHLQVVPPGIGIVHQVNLEYLARGVHRRRTASTTPTRWSAPTATPP